MKQSAECTDGNLDEKKKEPRFEINTNEILKNLQMKEIISESASRKTLSKLLQKESQSIQTFSNTICKVEKGNNSFKIAAWKIKFSNKLLNTTIVLEGN